MKLDTIQIDSGDLHFEHLSPTPDHKELGVAYVRYSEQYVRNLHKEGLKYWGEESHAELYRKYNKREYERLLKEGRLEGLDEWIVKNDSLLTRGLAVRHNEERIIGVLPTDGAWWNCMLRELNGQYKNRIMEKFHHYYLFNSLIFDASDKNELETISDHWQSLEGRFESPEFESKGTMMRIRVKGKEKLISVVDCDEEKKGRELRKLKDKRFKHVGTVYHFGHPHYTRYETERRIYGLDSQNIWVQGIERFEQNKQYNQGEVRFHNHYRSLPLALLISLVSYLEKNRMPVYKK